MRLQSCFILIYFFVGVLVYFVLRLFFVEDQPALFYDITEFGKDQEGNYQSFKNVNEVISLKWILLIWIIPVLYALYVIRKIQTETKIHNKLERQLHRINRNISRDRCPYGHRLEDAKNHPQ